MRRRRPAIRIPGQPVDPIAEFDARAGANLPRQSEYPPKVHAKSHNPQTGKDPLATGEVISTGIENVAGSADSFAISDHIHKLTVGEVEAFPESPSKGDVVQKDGLLYWFDGTNWISLGAITVTTQSGAPTVNGVTTLKFNNGVVTDNGSGVASIDVGLAVEESDGAPSLTGITKLIVDNTALSSVNASTARLQSSLRVREDDNNPNVTNVKELIFDNATLSNQGSGVVRVNSFPSTIYGSTSMIQDTGSANDSGSETRIARADHTHRLAARNKPSSPVTRYINRSPLVISKKFGGLSQYSDWVYETLSGDIPDFTVKTPNRVYGVKSNFIGKLDNTSFTFTPLITSNVYGSTIAMKPGSDLEGIFCRLISSTYRLYRTIDGFVTSSEVHNFNNNVPATNIKYSPSGNTVVAAQSYVASGKVIGISTNGGITWTNKSVPESFGTSAPFFRKETLLVLDDNTILGANEGSSKVYRSTNQGDSWTEVQPESSNHAYYGIYEYNGDVYLTGRRSNTPIGFRLWKSTNKGATWTLVTTALNQTFGGDSSDISKSRLAITDKSMLLFTVNTINNRYRIYHSLDGGQTFDQLNYLVCERGMSDCEHHVDGPHIFGFGNMNGVAGVVFHHNYGIPAWTENPQGFNSLQIPATKPCEFMKEDNHVPTYYDIDNEALMLYYNNEWHTFSSGGGGVIPVTESKSDDYTVTVDDNLKTFVMTTSNKTFTLPSVSSANIGLEFTFIKQNTGKLTIAASDSDIIMDSGAGKTIYNDQSYESYASITLKLATETLWVATAGYGTWITTY